MFLKILIIIVCKDLISKYGLYFSVKARLNWHRHDYSESDAGSKPVQTGTQVFIKELKSRHFPRYVDSSFEGLHK